MKLILVVLTILTAYVIYNFNNVYEPFKKFEAVNNNCKNVRGGDDIAAIEDLIHFEKYLIGTSDDRMKLWMLNDFGVSKTENGALVIYDTSDENSTIRRLQIENFPEGVAFHPHGISIYNNSILYVINHAYRFGGERVEVLSIKWDKEKDTVKVSYLKSIPFADDFAGILNDLAVVGEDEFYISTFLPFKDDVQNGRKPGMIRKYLSYAFIGLNLKFTYIYYCKSGQCTQVPGTGSLENNGMVYDYNDKLYAVNVLERRIRVYKINKNDMVNLNLIKDINLDYAIDNIDYDPATGEIYAAAIGNLYEQYNFIQEVLQTQKHASPNYWSGAIKIETKNNDKVSLVNMQKDFMYGVSSAVRKGNKIYMGSWIDKGILICQI